VSPGSVDGLVVIDKPAGWTSHDVVARLRRILGTRKVGHAGTLDPMATGVLVAGAGRGTRLLTYLVGSSKTYLASVRLGVSTLTDDLEGEVLHHADPASVAGVREADVRRGVAALTGTIQQVPSAVSAIKVDGRRSYARVRAGEQVELAAREVCIARFDVLDLRRADADDGAPVIDLDVVVDCSSGTYVRALARDLGAALGLGGHLTALRRTRVGPFTLDQAHTLDELAAGAEVTGLAPAARAVFPARELTEEEAGRLAHGRRIAPIGIGAGPAAAFGPDGALIALVDELGSTCRPLVVFVG